jgi:ribosomal protein L12E/L44/L45/RPP1/RPP2
LNEVISEGLEKLSTIPAGVGAGPAATEGKETAAKEEEVEEEEEEMEEGAMDLFGGDDDW